MSSPVSLLYAVLCNEFWDTPLPFRSLSHAQFQQLRQLALQQTVEGFLAGVLIRERIQLEQPDALLIFSRARMIEQLNYQTDQVLCQLNQLLTQENITHLIFKGQTLAQLYPHPAERTPGDIDFYCIPGHFRKAVSLLKECWQANIHAGESSQHYEFSYRQIPLEMHFRMIKFNSSHIQRYWDQLLSSTPYSAINIGSISVPILNPTLNVLYTFLHLYHHLVELGVGLRQFCDVLQLLHHYCTEIDRPLLAVHLDKMGFRHAFCAIGYILVHRLGLPEEEFPLPLSAHYEKYEHRIMDIVFTGGNFGKYISTTAVRSGWRYNIEATARKLKHYILFRQLSPREILFTLLKELPQKILDGIKR